jgi:hypothetical protein
MERKKNKEKESADKMPLFFTFAKWYGYVLAIMFLLYGGVKIVLGVMDRNYDGFAGFVIFLLYGLILISIVLAYRDRKTWGWYSMLVLNGLIILLSLLTLSHLSSYVLIVFSVLAIAALLTPETKAVIFKN